jgi:ankyrin repeat protein
MSSLHCLALFTFVIGQYSNDPTIKFAQAVQWGDVETVKAMLVKDNKLATSKVSNGNLPLQTAADSGNQVIADILIGAGAKLDIEMAAALGKKAEVAAMLKVKPWLVKAPNRPLQSAAEHGHVEIVKLLLDRGADPNLDDGHGFSGRHTPLSHAVTAGYFEVAKLLCESGARTDVAGFRGGENLFDYAVDRCEVRFVKLLLEHGADVNSADDKGETALHVVAGRGDLAKAKVLLDFKADVNATSDSGLTPLLYALSTQHDSMCEFLIARGAKLDIFSACALGKYAEATALLKSAPQLVNARDKIRDWPLLLWAARGGDRRLVELILALGADPMARAPELDSEDRKPNSKPEGATKYLGETALHVAVNFRRQEIARLLIDKGIPVNAKTKSGGTPLDYACGNHDSAMIKLLLSKGAEIRDSKSSGALLRSALDDKECVAILLAAGADPKLVDNEGNSLLFSAAYDGHPEVAELLLAHGAKLDLHAACLLGKLDDVKSLLAANPKRLDAPLSSNQYHDETPLVLAARGGHLPIVEFLVAQGAVFDPAKMRYPSPMAIAARYGKINVIDWFLKKGMPVDARPENDEPTALMEACAYSQLEAVRFLLEKKADPTITAKFSGTALHRTGSHPQTFRSDNSQTPAARADQFRRDAQIVRLLIQFGASVNARDRSGETPLHSAAFGAYVEFASLLIQLGADINARDHCGRTPLWCAERSFDSGRERQAQAMVEFLCQHGGRQ